ncbi:MAG: universal stress protein [Bacteroidia bacterium]|nr:universal stress protein [Bacteroidia bacterium]
MIIKDNQAILIPIDFTKLSYIAVKQTYNLARYTKSKLVLIHISPNSDSDRKADLENLAESTQAESGLKVETMGAKGELYSTIIKVATDIDASLVVLALEENAKFKSGMFSSAMTVPKFLTTAHCPIITLRSTDLRDGCKNIIMPFDLSPESREKVSYAVQLARLYNADIKIISVFKPNDEEYENKLFPYLQQVKKFIKAEGVHCTNRTLPSATAAEAIVEYAVKSEGDIIIQMNQQDLSLTEKFGAGTVGHKIVEISPIPVLNVNPMKRESMSHFSSGM